MALTREEVAYRGSREIGRGQVVNLGIGIPTLVANFVEAGWAWIHSENGIVGVGPSPQVEDVDSDLINAGKEPVTVVPGSSIFDSSISFGMIRGGRVDLALMGAMQVSATGDLANWMVPGQLVPGIGGAMDLAVGARRLVILMTHTDARGAPKLLKVCTLPLTATGRVRRVITDLGVIDITESGFVLREIAPDVTIDHLLAVTDAPLVVDPNLETINLANVAN